MSCTVCRRKGSDPALLWLWYRPASSYSSNSTPSLAWEPPYATGVALKRQKTTEEEDTQPLTQTERVKASRKCSSLACSRGLRVYEHQCVHRRLGPAEATCALQTRDLIRGILYVVENKKDVYLVWGG